LDISMTAYRCQYCGNPGTPYRILEAIDKRGLTRWRCSVPCLWRPA
jgi:hypothetical protein